MVETSDEVATANIPTPASQHFEARRKRTVFVGITNAVRKDLMNHANTATAWCPCSKR